MAYKMEQFAVKLSYLKACLSRPENSKNVTDYGTITSLMKYFKQVVLSVQAEKSADTPPWIPIRSKESVSQQELWRSHLASYPALQYSTLHEITLSILQHFSFATDSKDACACLLEMLLHTLPFVEEEVGLELPLQVASLLPEGNFDFHGLIINTLCDSIIPMCLGYFWHDSVKSYLCAVVPAIVTISFEFVTDSSLHMKLLETLMIFKENIWQDLLTVIAYGSEPAKICAARYLFHYWPELQGPEMTDHVIPMPSMQSVTCCENKSCGSKNDIVATFVLFDPSLSARYGWKHAPLYLCGTCKETVSVKNGLTYSFEMFLRKDVISHSCQNKNCFSWNKEASVTVCGNEMCVATGDACRAKPLDKHRTRYCKECYNNLSKCFRKDQLLIQNSPTILWNLNTCEDRAVMVDAITKLLDGDSDLLVSGNCDNSYEDVGKTSYFYLSMIDGDNSSVSIADPSTQPVNFCFVCGACRDNFWNADGGPQCQFGIWLLLALCPVVKNLPLEEVYLENLLSATIQWCADATYLPNDNYGSKLENLKFQLMKDWISEFCTLHFQSYLSYLLPRKRSRGVADQWYTLCPRWGYYCNGLRLILCLGSYSAINKDIWNEAMLAWLQFFEEEHDEVKDKEPLKEVITKLFDVDLSPLPFESKYLFQFAIQTCEDSDVKVQRRGFAWLQMLTEMGVVIPMTLILQTFLDTTRLLTSYKSPMKQANHWLTQSITSLHWEDQNDSYSIQNSNNEALECHLSMLNTLQKQMNLQRIGTGSSLQHNCGETLFMLLAEQLTWICDKKQAQNRDFEDKNWMNHGLKSLSSEKEEETRCLEDLIITWLCKAFGILNATAKNTDTQSRASCVSSGVESPFEDISDQHTIRLSMKLLELLSIQRDPVQQYITLRILKLFPTLADESTVSNNQSGNEFSLQFLQLWSKISSECYDLFSCATSILLQLLMCPSVAEIFLAKITNLLAAPEWILRYDTIGRMRHLLDSVKHHHVQKHTPFTSVISSCMCSLMNMLDDDRLEVQTKCMHVIGNISLSSLKHVSNCLELQFTAMPQQRTDLLCRMQTINLLRPEANLFAVFNSACVGYVVKRGRFGLDQDVFGGGGLQQTSDFSIAHETVHLLIQIVSKCVMDHSYDRKTAESKCFQSMLKNLFAHFGYNDQIGIFTLNSLEVRNSIGLPSFLLNLPKILDCNMHLGSMFVSTAISLLESSIFPEVFAMDSHKISHQITLQSLPESLRLSWLSSLLLLLYKFGIPDDSQLMRLVIVCLNTLESEIHLCSSDRTLLQGQATRNTDPMPKFQSGVKSPTCLVPHIASYDTEEVHRKSRHSCGLSDVQQKCLEAEIPTQPFHPAKSVTKTHPVVREGFITAECSSTDSIDHLKDIQYESAVDEEYSPVKKRSLASVTSLSPSPLRHRNNSEISKEWSKVISVPLQLAVVNSRCHKCKEKLVRFSSKVMSKCILNLCYFIKFNSEIAAPLLPRILIQLIHISNLLGDRTKEKRWSSVLLEASTISSSRHVYMNVSKVARQSVRCILQQLTNNLLLTKIFLLPLEDRSFLHGLALCLADYQTMNSLTVVKIVIEGLPPDLKNLSHMEFSFLIKNLSVYMSNLPHDTSSSPHWQQLLSNFCSFCSKLLGAFPFEDECKADDVLNIIMILLKCPSPVTAKQALLESSAKLLVAILQKSCFTVKTLQSLCSASCKVFTRTKEKFFLIHYVVSEVISCLKLKNRFLHENIFMLLQLILVDAGSCLNPCAYQTLEAKKFTLIRMNVLPCYMMECIKPYLPDCLEIIADLEFLGKLKDHVISNQTFTFRRSAFHDVKVSIAQLVCLELSQTTQQDKALQSLLPWIYETPSVQQGPKDYMDCVCHLRQLSWLLLGSLTHMGLFYSDISSAWQPLPVELSSHLASIVQVILTGFPSQYMDSLTSLSSLFYVFVFCELWTLYCDELSRLIFTSNTGVQTPSVLGWDQNLPRALIMEFWSRVTPSILLLLQHNKSVSELVRIHILALTECLQECNSAVVFKLYSLWKIMMESGLDNGITPGSTDSHESYVGVRLHQVHSFYSSVGTENCSEEDSKGVSGQMNGCAIDSNRSANKLLRIVDQIKQRLAQEEITSKVADNLHNL